jgi:hypothetical protein
MVGAILLAAAASVSTSSTVDNSGEQSMLNEESPDVFLAKATLQQYLSRVVRKDWDGVRHLTHPKALGIIEQLDKGTGAATHNLAPWANEEWQLKTFRFTGTRQVAPGIVLLQVGEDTYCAEEQGMSIDDPAVYILFKSRGAFLIGDKKAGVGLGDVSDDSVAIGYPGYLDKQVEAQARREPGLHDGRHR